MNRSLSLLGLLGLGLAVLCSAIALFTGMHIAPEGDLTKAITFDGAVGVYILTIGLFVPFARFSPQGGRWWLGWTIGFGIYAYAVETVQTLRGLDPRFSHFFAPVDQVAGSVFGATAIGLIVTFMILAAKLVSKGTDGEHGLLLLSIRYACCAVLMAFAAGLWMIVIQGRKTGAAGNLLPLHAVGFHGLQAIPILAFLFVRSDLPEGVSRRWIHVAGLAWMGLCLAILIQTAAGRPVTEISPETVFGAALFAIWLAAGVFSARSWWIASRELPARTEFSPP